MSINRTGCCCGGESEGACCLKSDTNTYFPCLGECVITRLDTNTIYQTLSNVTSGQCNLPQDWGHVAEGAIGDCICYTANYPPQSIGLTTDAVCTAMIGQSIDVGEGGDQTVTSVYWDDNEFPYTAEWTQYPATGSGQYYHNCFPPERVLTCSCVDDLTKAECEATNGTAVGLSTVWVEGGTCPNSCLGCTCERGVCIAIAGGAHVESECDYILRHKQNTTTWTRGSNCDECVTAAGDTDTYTYKISKVTGSAQYTIRAGCNPELGSGLGCRGQGSKLTSGTVQQNWTNEWVADRYFKIGSTVGGVYTANAQGIAEMNAWSAEQVASGNYYSSSVSDSECIGIVDGNTTSTQSFITQTYDCPYNCDCWWDTFMTATFVGYDPVNGAPVNCYLNILCPVETFTATSSGCDWICCGYPCEPYSGTSFFTRIRLSSNCDNASFCHTGCYCNQLDCPVGDAC